MDILHIIYTKFNIRVAWTQDVTGTKIDPLDPNWIQNRILLFKKYCFPSVEKQSCQNFKWLVHFHEQTAPEIYAEFQKYPNFVPFLDNEHFTQRVKNIGAGNTEYKYLITTRLDSDDGLNKFYVQTVQEQLNKIRTHINGVDKLAINFDNGMILNYDRHYSLVHEPSNPFVSLIEKLPCEPVTVIVHKHGEMTTKFPARHIVTSQPMWFRVVHEHNISNKFVGRKKGKLTTEMNWYYNIGGT